MRSSRDVRLFRSVLFNGHVLMSVKKLYTHALTHVGARRHFRVCKFAEFYRPTHRSHVGRYTCRTLYTKTTDTYYLVY